VAILFLLTPFLTNLVSDLDLFLALGDQSYIPGSPTQESITSAIPTPGSSRECIYPQHGSPPGRTPAGPGV
jgi:hypothetical protein